MSILKLMITGVALGLPLAGCVTETAIIAGAVDTVGISAGAGSQDQGANLTVGYKGAKFAVVPAENQAGQLLALQNGPDKQKGLSVFAMLGIDAKAPPTASANVNQVLAVGPAAELYASRVPTH